MLSIRLGPCLSSNQQKSIRKKVEALREDLRKNFTSSSARQQLLVDELRWGCLATGDIPDINGTDIPKNMENHHVS